jgi:hypothetical protein
MCLFPLVNCLISLGIIFLVGSQMVALDLGVWVNPKIGFSRHILGPSYTCLGHVTGAKGGGM